MVFVCCLAMDLEDSEIKKLKRDSFYKQQQQRLQHININKDLSADDLIKNILEKVDNDAKISKFYQTTTTTTSHPAKPPVTSSQQQQQQYSTIPIPQCFLKNPEIPDVYLQVWTMVKKDDETSEFCDREKLYQILISSTLSNEILASLWSYVNRTRPGELTRNELFILLALIGLVQNSTNNPLNELYLITNIPVPKFGLAGPIPDPLPPPKIEKEILPNESIIENEFCEFQSANLDNKPVINEVISTTTSIISDTSQSEITPTTAKNAMDTLDLFFCDFSSTQSITIPTNETIGTVKESFSILDTCNDGECLPPVKKELSPPAEQVIEEFGDFQSMIGDDIVFPAESEFVAFPENGTTNHISNQQKILTSIKQVIHKVFNIITVNHDQESVIEALSSVDGIEYTKDLFEVYRIAIRIKDSLELDGKKFLNKFEMDLCKNLLDEIFSNWNSIHNLLKKASIDLDEPTGDLVRKNSDTSKKCAICLVSESNENDDGEDQDQDHGGGKSFCIWHENICYHTSCANFWLNYVNPTLPLEQN